MKKQLTDIAGFTVVELLIAMQLAALVIALAYSSYLFMSKLAIRWQEKTVFEQQLALTGQALTTTIGRVTRVTGASANSFTAITDDSTTANLEISETLLINRKPVGGVISLPIVEGTIRYRLNNKPGWREGHAPFTQTELARIDALKLELLLTHRGREQRFEHVQRLLKKTPFKTAR